MKPLNLLIVAIRQEWLSLLEDSLQYAGYQFNMTLADSKQSAIKAFHESRYDLLISNCILPDGRITDLADVLGSQLPCLVMAETHCPVTSQLTLAIADTNYYMNAYDRLGWIPALENTLAKWRSNVQQKLEQHNRNHDTLYRKALARCTEMLSDAKVDDEAPVTEVFELMVEVMQLSRLALYGYKGSKCITPFVESSAAGVPTKNIISENPLEVPFFRHWEKSLEAGETVFESVANLQPADAKWLLRHDIQSILAVPVMANGHCVAYLSLEDVFEPREWNELEKSLAISVAGLIAKVYFTSQKSSRFDTAFQGSPA